MEWIKGNPTEEGFYFVFAPSADPLKPVYAAAWWNGERWELIIEYWGNSVTHHAKPFPPDDHCDLLIDMIEDGVLTLDDGLRLTARPQDRGPAS
jgi:hypothetical protein